MHVKLQNVLTHSRLNYTENFINTNPNHEQTDQPRTYQSWVSEKLFGIFWFVAVLKILQLRSLNFE